MTISLQENRDLPHSVTGTFGVCRMDLVNGYPYFFLQQRLDHDGICSLQRLEALCIIWSTFDVLSVGVMLMRW